MESRWGLYSCCVDGLFLSLVCAFFANGGGALVSNYLPGPLKGILGHEVIPLPWPRIALQPDSTLEKAVCWTLVAIFLMSAPAIMQWLIGFLWPLGIVNLDCLSSLTTPILDSKSSGTTILNDEETQDAKEHEKTALLHDTDVESQPKCKRIISLRVVTRGDSPSFISETCSKNIQVVLDFFENKTKCNSDAVQEFEWILEVVTESPLDLEERLGSLASAIRVFEILVPKDYITPNGTKSKARNLHYANTESVSCLADEDFLVHLDEETLITTSTITAALEFARKTPERIGQGMTVFGRVEKIGNYMLTMCDTTRFTDDYCSFRLWHSLGIALRGMKGSNFMVMLGVERLISFDVGPGCSLLEDAAFALVAAQKGVKFCHVQSLMWETSPLTYTDYFRQRRRWINGLTNVAFESSINFRYRALLILSLTAWICAPVTLIAFLIIVLVFHIPATITTVLTRVMITAIPSWGAVWGASQSFSPVSRGWFCYIMLIVANLLVLPICTLLEASAVIFALVMRTTSFEVVRKNV